MYFCLTEIDFFLHLGAEDQQRAINFFVLDCKISKFLEADTEETKRHVCLPILSFLLEAADLQILFATPQGHPNTAYLFLRS